jgi:hypothetical protein
MKRAIVASLLGIATSIATSVSYGQGQIIFDTYNAAAYSPIRYTSDANQLPDPGLAGQIVGAGSFSATLLYGIGSGFTSIDQLTSISGLAVAVGSQVPGYAVGPAVTIPGYVSGPVTFAVLVWASSGPNGGPTYDQSMLRGASALWVEPSISAVPNPAGNFTVGVPGINNVALVPEPSTVMLAGLGALSVLLLRRKRE